MTSPFTASAAQGATGTPAARVLAVDDSPANLALLEQVLVREGYVVLQARDGHEALEMVMTESPDLVISDVMMPRKNGFELCRAIKAHPSARLTPVVLLTTLRGDPALSAVPVIVFSNAYTPDRMEKLWQAGATQVLVKASSTPKVILEAVRTALATHQ